MMRRYLQFGLFTLSAASSLLAYQEGLAETCFIPASQNCPASEVACGTHQLLWNVTYELMTEDDENEPRQKPVISYEPCPDNTYEGIDVDMDPEPDCAEGNQAPEGTNFQGSTKTKTCWIKRPCQRTAVLSTILDQTFYEQDWINGHWVDDEEGPKYKAYKAVCGSFAGVTVFDVDQPLDWTECTEGMNCD